MIRLVDSLRGTSLVYAEKDAYVAHYTAAAADRIETLERILETIRNAVEVVDNEKARQA